MDLPMQLFLEGEGGGGEVRAPFCCCSYVLCTWVKKIVRYSEDFVT